eukprot:2645532-Alexandrium_andersonii.AAC.1
MHLGTARHERRHLQQRLGGKQRWWQNQRQSHDALLFGLGRALQPQLRKSRVFEVSTRLNPRTQAGATGSRPGADSRCLPGSAAAFAPQPVPVVAAAPICADLRFRPIKFMK